MFYFCCTFLICLTCLGIDKSQNDSIAQFKYAVNVSLPFFNQSGNAYLNVRLERVSKEKARIGFLKVGFISQLKSKGLTLEFIDSQLDKNFVVNAYQDLNRFNKELLKSTPVKIVFKESGLTLTARSVNFDQEQSVIQLEDIILNMPLAENNPTQFRRAKLEFNTKLNCVELVSNGLSLTRL